MDSKVIDAARAAFPASGPAITLGAVAHGGAIHPEPLIAIPLAMLNRHGLIAGATGTGKTKTLQLVAEQLARAGVPVFVSDVKGDLSGIAAAGGPHPKVDERSKATGYAWNAQAMPVEFLSLTGARGAQLRATVSSFGPMLLAKVLGLNDTQTSVLTLVFKYCDDQGLLLLDLADLRAALQHLSGDGADALKDYGGLSKQTVGVLLRELVELEAQGAAGFFGEPEFELEDLLQVERDGRGLISVLELPDVQDKPRLWSTFMLWMLATLYNELPEVGDLEKPKLVFFFDEAHLLFAEASPALLEQVERVVRLIRSKGVGVFFITQSPKDVPPSVLGQLGHRVQHALRAFTADDEKALKAAARTFPKTAHYDLEETLTTLGIGQALVTVLAPNGVPTPPFATHLVPPCSRMGPLTDAELGERTRTPQVRKYATTIDRESAREMLAKKVADPDATTPAPARGRPVLDDGGPVSRGGGAAYGGARRGRPRMTMGEKVATQAARTATSAIMRGVLDALIGGGRRRR
jgi:hypothetical protein